MPRWTPDGVNPNYGKASYSVVFYAKDRFTVNEAKSGTFMFTDTPDVIGSKIPESSMPRCATYVTLTDVNTGKEFVVVNMHLDHVGGQIKQATVLVNELIKRVGKDTPMLITGDMNSKLDSSAIQHLMNNPTLPLHSFDYLASETYWSDSAKFGIIDWVFTNVPEKIDVSYYRFCNDFNMFYSRWTGGKLQMYMPSDHPAIYCEFSFKD
jgi:endonuclease/exonuclease/phosphatase family metal-dependent hydrolase